MMLVVGPLACLSGEITLTISAISHLLLNVKHARPELLYLEK